ncbi:phosphoribosyltransferase [Leifsonia sp. Root112D2]|jgi:hypoxanthine phosphoribosyltransferase|uniref:phosphoribosyltransferase n=1 Tax=Leifsonia sp. Root112D2 TaxID=1736426 RepID=UPI0006F2DE3F|nr:phosphoribosyltransferase family protein [Leifsonia sp. Root112D2]KQV05962.1 phosphoribosyltransferase [Leifsonia sp. Root112D2]
MAFDVDDSGIDTIAESDREVLGWLEFGEAARHLASAVLESGYEPDVVLAIARGGLLLAGAMSYALGVKSCGAVNVEFYTGIDERLPEPVLLPPLLEEAALHSKRVLLVDDVADSGRTLAMVVELVRAGGAEVRTVCLYGKPQSVIEPDFTWRKTSQWITFPWSALPPVQTRLDA